MGFNDEGHAEVVRGGGCFGLDDGWCIGGSGCEDQQKRKGVYVVVGVCLFASAAKISSVVIL